MAIEHRLERIEQALRRIENLLFINTRMELRQMDDFTALNAAVAKQTDLIASVKTMMEGLRAQQAQLQADLDAAIAAGDDQEAIDAAQAAVDANNAILEAITAVATGTPAEVPAEG